MQQRVERLEKINSLIEYIGAIDKNRYRPVLHTKNENGEFDKGCFKFGDNGLLYFIDSSTKEPIRPIDAACAQRDNYFSGGGNLWWLVQSFGKYIMNGQYGELRDYKEIWGFDFETTMKVRNRAKEIGFIKSVDYPHELHPKTASQA